MALAGLGGAGGSQLLTLTRLGIGGFHIADLDTFSVENFNRQAGATMKTIGRTKVEVMAEMALAINPELRIKTFSKGVNAENVDEFFTGVDAYADSLDFFAFEARRLVFRHCHKHKIPATTVGPIGMGAALVNFMPGTMSFDDYFNWKDDDSKLDLAIKFLLGVSPKTPHRSYVVDSAAIRLGDGRGPSTPMGIELCAGVMGTEILKILLKRGRVLSAPHSTTFDAFKNKVFHTYMMFGNRNPIQKIKFAVAKKMMSSSV